MRVQFVFASVVVAAVVETPRTLRPAHVVPRFDERITVREEEVAEVITRSIHARRRVVRRTLRRRVVRLGSIEPQPHDIPPIDHAHDERAFTAHNGRHVRAVKQEGNGDVVRYADLGMAVARRHRHVGAERHIRGCRPLVSQVRRVQRAVRRRNEHVCVKSVCRPRGVRRERPLLEHELYASLAAAQARTGIHFPDRDRTVAGGGVLEIERSLDFVDRARVGSLQVNRSAPVDLARELVRGARRLQLDRATAEVDVKRNDARSLFRLPEDTRDIIPAVKGLIAYDDVRRADAEDPIAVDDWRHPFRNVRLVEEDDRRAVGVEVHPLGAPDRAVGDDALPGDGEARLGRIERDIFKNGRRIVSERRLSDQGYRAVPRREDDI